MAFTFENTHVFPVCGDVLCISSSRKEPNGRKSARAVDNLARLVENDTLLPTLRQALLVYLPRRKHFFFVPMFRHLEGAGGDKRYPSEEAGDDELIGLLTIE